jgi:D-alanyl-D-alanine dipeptidase
MTAQDSLLNSEMTLNEKGKKIWKMGHKCMLAHMMVNSLISVHKIVTFVGRIQLLTH